MNFEALEGAAGGWCDMRARRIVVDATAPINAQVRTLVHECAHALGVDDERYSRAQAEVIVDTVTFIVAAGAGLEVEGESVPYIAGWGEDGALDAVSEFAETIDRVARQIEAALPGVGEVTPQCRECSGAVRVREPEAAAGPC